MDQETVRLFISSGAVVAAALLTAIAAVIVPLIVQTRQHRADRKWKAADELRTAVVDMVNTLMADEHYDDRWEEPRSLVQLRRERAFAALDTLLAGKNAPVSDWLRGFLGDRPFQPGPAARRAYIHAGLRDLISWQQGVLKRKGLVPFTYAPNGQGGHLRRNREQWQQEAAGGMGDKAPA